MQNIIEVSPKILHLKLRVLEGSFLVYVCLLNN